MLGFATVDLCKAQNTLTVWLTSASAHGIVSHSNAVTFAVNSSIVPAVASGLLIDRYVVLTARTHAGQHPIGGWNVHPCDLSDLADQIRERQDAIMAAFLTYKKLPGKHDLVDLILPALPEPFEQRDYDEGRPAVLALAVADAVAQTWQAWLACEKEREKRHHYMPAAWGNDSFALLPARFQRLNVLNQLWLAA